MLKVQVILTSQDYPRDHWDPVWLGGKVFVWKTRNLELNPKLVEIFSHSQFNVCQFASEPP